MKQFKWHAVVVGILLCIVEFLTPESRHAAAFAGGMFLSFGIFV